MIILKTWGMFVICAVSKKMFSTKYKKLCKHSSYISLTISFKQMAFYSHIPVPVIYHVTTFIVETIHVVKDFTSIAAICIMLIYYSWITVFATGNDA